MDQDIFNQKHHHRTEYIILLSLAPHSRARTREQKAPDIDLTEEDLKY